jgi:hypothetical protein
MSAPLLLSRLTSYFSYNFIFLVQFDAIEDIGQAHHILLFGCKEPARTTPTW